MSIIDYDRGYMKGLLEGIEDGDEVISLEFFEHLIVEGLISVDMHRTPMSQVDSYLRTIQGQRAVGAWAKAEAVDQAMAV